MNYHEQPPQGYPQQGQYIPQPENQQPSSGSFGPSKGLTKQHWIGIAAGVLVLMFGLGLLAGSLSTGDTNESNLEVATSAEPTEDAEEELADNPEVSPDDEVKVDSDEYRSGANDVIARIHNSGEEGIESLKDFSDREIHTIVTNVCSDLDLGISIEETAVGLLEQLDDVYVIGWLIGASINHACPVHNPTLDAFFEAMETPEGVDAIEDILTGGELNAADQVIVDTVREVIPELDRLSDAQVITGVDALCGKWDASGGDIGAGVNEYIQESGVTVDEGHRLIIPAGWARCPEWKDKAEVYIEAVDAGEI